MTQLEPVARNATAVEAQVVGWAYPGNPAAAGGDLEAAEVEGGMPAPVEAEDGLPLQAALVDSAAVPTAAENCLPPQAAVEYSASVPAVAAQVAAVGGTPRRAAANFLAAAGEDEVGQPAAVSAPGEKRVGPARVAVGPAVGVAAWVGAQWRLEPGPKTAQKSES